MVFKVKIQPSGHEFDVETDETVLDAALRQSIDLPYGCRGGACGSCLGMLLSGQVRYEEEPIALTDELRQTGKALFCMAIPETDLVIGADELEELADIQIKNLRCRVEQKVRMNHDVIALKLKLAGDERLQYHAGQYIEFILEDGKRRAFSIANAPHKDELIELHIRHVDGGVFTDFLFEEMPDKSLLRIEGPLGSFYLRENSERPILMVGGGTGFGPIKAMVEHAMYVGLKQPVHIFMGVRALRDLYMKEMVEDWFKENSNIKFVPVLSQSMKEDNWQGETGYVHEAVGRMYEDLSGFDIYLCGPPPMINSAVELFIAKGADRNHMYSDAFEYSADARKALEGK
ncbi:MAG: CDP-6-deoxy-delta-3,4-glucoseen reductase [Gammaproteobacteria bacterium]|nr:CDP-6-deoxy-delta-3,4-glucoseen reductase [Gammaproteobacteria bacterium]